MKIEKLACMAGKQKQFFYFAEFKNAILDGIKLKNPNLNDHYQRRWNFDRQECLPYPYQTVGQTFLSDYIFNCGQSQNGLTTSIGGGFDQFNGGVFLSNSLNQ